MAPAVLMFPYLAEQHRSVLGPGPEPATHLKSTDRGYVTTQDVAGERILLVDDTFTTGGRAQSAASVLQLAGARVVAMVAIGRVINPSFNDESKALWDRAKDTPFDFDVCCLDE